MTKQYRSVLFYGNSEEKKVCNDAIKAKQELLNKTIYADVEPLNGTTFYRAEEYHQDYFNKHAIRKY
jgi:peptide-methionine (S)-S-oxide reductase